jgi:2-polyprenyl-3-methyl-5-hydroxy-6-metoxy-1,4-benzoquinol methylase
VDDTPLFDGSSEVLSPLVSCTNCSHVTVHPIPNENSIREYYRSAEYWQNHGVTEAFASSDWLRNLTSNPSLWERFNRAQGQLRLILNHAALPKTAKILDLGSGYAPFLYHCRRQGFTDLYALEPPKNICRYLEDQGVTTYPMLMETFITLEGLPSFDLIILSSGLQHLISPDEVLGGVRNLLSSNGLLFIEVPYHKYKYPYARSLQLHFFSERSLSHLLTTCGYSLKTARLNRLNPIEAMLERAIYSIHGKTYFKKRRTVKNILESPLSKYLYPYCWKPLKKLLSLKNNIFLHSETIYALASR